MKICLACGKALYGNNWRCLSCNFSPKTIGGYLAFSPDLEKTSNGFNAEYFAQLYPLEERHFWFLARNLLIIWAMQYYFPGAKNFFEIGCGTGFVLNAIENKMPNILLYGSDIFSSALNYASKRLRKVELFQMDARKIPFQNEFDVIGAFDVLEHIDKDELVLSQMNQALCKNGGIILTVPQHDFLWSRFDEISCHVRRYNSYELKSKVEKAGFKVIRITSFVSLLLPVMMVSRFKCRYFKKEYDVMAELKLGSLINTVFEKVLDFERYLINIGIGLPFGGSLLLIARKV